MSVIFTIKARDRFLASRQMLEVPKYTDGVISDEDVKKVFSELRTQLKNDIKIYGEEELPASQHA